MEQESAGDCQWISYFICILVYVLIVICDGFSAIIFVCLMVEFVGLWQKKFVLLAIQVVLVGDFVFKSRYFQLVNQLNLGIFVVDYRCVDMLLHKNLQPQLFVYVVTHIFTLYLLISSICKPAKKSSITWGPPMTQVMVYTCPVLMYGLSIISVNSYIKIVWAGVSCLQILDKFSKLNHLICCVVIMVFFFWEDGGKQYDVKVYEVEISEMEGKGIMVGVFAVLMVFLNVYSNPHPNYKQNLSRDVNEEENVVAKRDVQDEQSINRLKSKAVILLSAVLYLLTTSLGNIFILLAIYFNIPLFQARRFFIFIGIGILVAMVLSPQQVLYFCYLYFVVLILGQSVDSKDIMQSQTHSYSFFLDFYRLYIMLNHVSFINWLIGLFRNSSILVIALSIRVICRHFGYVSVFLGTTQNYEIWTQFFNFNSVSDFVLVIYLILLGLYNQTKTITYEGSTVTDVMREYPLLVNIQKILVCFRIFNWLSYVVFSLIILSRKPSLYITIHIFNLVLILLSDTIIQSKTPTKQKVLKVLWSINFYITIIMIFTRYFYFLKQYNSNSQVMDYLLDVLTRYRFWIGIDQLKGAKEGVELGMYFLYDGGVIGLSWINVYIYEFKIYYGGRSGEVRDGNLSEPLLKKDEDIEDENMRYFYDRFIKPVDLTAYLAHHQYKVVEKVIRDCILDACFGVIVFAFYMEDKTDYILYLPLFGIAVYAFYQRFRYKVEFQFSQKILGFCTAWSFIILFSSYLYITYLQMFNQDIPMAIVRVHTTYILCIIICLIYKICLCLPNRPKSQKSYHCLIYLCFPMEIECQKLWTEILSIVSQFWMAVTMALFFTNIFSGKIISTVVHPVVIGYLLVTKIGRVKSQYWIYIVCIVSIFDIWNYDFFAYFTVVASTIFYAIKTAQKLSQEQLNILPRDSVIDSEYAGAGVQQQQMIKKQQQKWIYYMVYCTVIWHLPQIISLVWMFGVVLLAASWMSIVLILFSYGNLVYQMLAEREPKISQGLLIAILGITVFFLCYEIEEYINVNILNRGNQKYQFSPIGLFLIFGSSFWYLILRKRGEWYKNRAQDAKQYWDIKSELVGELGSQLHNEKKLLNLQKFYNSKQRLIQKVNKISLHLKQNTQKPYFQSFDNILFNKQEDQSSYELFTNMLVFFDMHSLKKCFLMLNQYIKVEKHQNVCQKAKYIRKQIRRAYQRSFGEAFNRFKMESENRDEGEKQLKMEEQQSERSSTVNLELVNEINRRYKECFQIISKITSQFNRVFRFVVQNIEIVSMTIVIGWNLFGGVYTIPANFIIFGWAIVLQNKTTVLFWTFMMSYTCLILIMKQVIIYLPNVYILNFIFYYHAQDFLYQYFLVLISVVQITILKLGGARFKTYSQRQSIYDAFYRTALNKVMNGAILDREEEFMGIYKNLSEPKKHSFWYRVFSKSRFKPGKDYYPLMSGIQLFILLYIFFFYDMMELESRNNRKSFGELLTISQFSSHMVIALFLQIIIMIIDRLIVSLNLVDEENQLLENFFFSFTFSMNQVKYQPPSKLDKIGLFDLLLVLKYFFHMVLLFGINFFVYFYIPSSGLTKNLIPVCNINSECNKSYKYLSIFLILYFSYFIVSGLQIKYGFNRNKCKNVLMEKYNWNNYYVYKVFTVIPFAWEFKKICDWSITSTALPLFHWMKFQDINARLYQSKCEAEMIKIKPLGTPWNKYFLGPFGFIGILLLVFSPFIVYSSVNPFAVKDAVIGAQAELYLRMDERDDYKFFSTSHAKIYEGVEGEFDVELNNQNLFMLKMSKFPDQNFLVSEPVVEKLADKIKGSLGNLGHKFQFVLYLTVIQQEGGESSILWSKKQLETKELENLHAMLTLKSNSTTISNFYNPFPGQKSLQSIIIQSPNEGEYFEVSITKKTVSNELIFYFLTSNKFKVGIGILTFYITYVLVISRLMRFYLTGNLQNILYQGCYVDTILTLCQAVRQARIVQNFLEQQSFYFQLVDIMRHPKVIKQISGDFLNFRKKYIQKIK